MNSSFTEKQGINLGAHTIGSGNDLFFIAGPCVIESEQLCMEIAEEISRICKPKNIPVIFKASFDKANRTSIESFRGPGLRKGLEILAKVREKTGLPVISDIHSPDQAPLAGEVLDVIQIPAFLSRQTDLLVAAGNTGKPLNIKKGQFQAPDDVKHALGKIRSTGNNQIMITERGSTFGYNDLVADMRSIVRLKSFGCPVVFDATHSAQMPGAGNACSSGDRTIIAPLARAAVASGCDGVFMEVHPDPDRALCDGPNSLNLADLESLLTCLTDIHEVVNPYIGAAASTLQPTRTRSVEREQTFFDRLKEIRLIIFDVDGILTDGRITFGSGDLEIKSFNVRDGHGIKIAIRSGLNVALVTGRKSDVVSRRARELGIERLYQGMKDKRPALAELMSDLNLTPEEIAVVGDDVVDIPLMRRVGVAITVPEAPGDVLAEAHFVTQHNGGIGAAREIVEMILKAQDKWNEAMARYYA